VRISEDRLLRRIEAIGQIGCDGAGGVTRPGFTPADLEARHYFIEEARGASLLHKVDPAGNILVRRDPAATQAADRQVLMMGSHLDTVVNGGRLDGVYGVIAALEVLQVLVSADVDLPYEPVAVAFANEEGAVFPQPFWGSMALAGRQLDLPTEPVDPHGRLLRDAIARAGGDMSALRSAAWPANSVAAYLELHIEQGAQLEESQNRIGIVESIVGRTVLTLDIRGTAAHAGTTAMTQRRDPLVAAAQVILDVEQLSAKQHLCRVSTVGRLNAYPNSPNTVAGDVQLTVDLRDANSACLRSAEEALIKKLRNIEAATQTTISVTAQTRSDPVYSNSELCRVIEQGAKRLDLSCISLPSGAGHDAQMIADIAPIAMIFVPSIGGVSHVPEENTSPDDLLAGAQVLLEAALSLEHLLGTS
jgi:N-carbamoyl-L-amino-acid hydrolase